MKKSFQHFALGCLAVCFLFSSVETSQAGVIPWAYDAIFGPVGSIRNHMGAYGPMFGTYRARRIGYYPGNLCQPACNSGCSTSNYQAGYYPAYSYYGGYGVNSCNSCYSGGCNSCSQGCASGNCSSVSTPAAGITPVPATNSSAPVPTTTYKSLEPTVKPDAIKKSTSEEKTKKKYDESDSSSEGFSLPARPDEKTKPETKTEKKTDAPAFGLPFGTKSTESLKVPTAPLVPVEKRKPAPAVIEENGGVKIPSLQLVPSPVAIEDSQVTHMRASVRTRTARSARFTIPQVARVVPSPNGSLIPPLPSPVQLAGK